MKKEEHEQETICLLGSPFTEVHTWLDQFAGRPECGMRHRKKLHHLEGIEMARKLFGDNGAEVARQHIMSDLNEEGWDERIDKFPANEQDYTNMGFF